MVILGGMGNVWGVCLGGAVLSYLNYQGLEAVGNNVNNIAGTSFNVPQYTYGIFGLIIVVMMLLRPQGLIPRPAAEGRAASSASRADRSYDASGAMTDNLLEAASGAQGVRRPGRLQRRRLHRAAGRRS